MPDVSAPAHSPTPASHTATEQWQSFEMRMRYRRAERCVLRAQVALESGFEDEARAALEEAQRLNSHAPDIETIRTALDQQTASRLAEQRAVQRGRASRAATAAVLILCSGAGAFWVARQAPTGSTPDAIAKAERVPAAAPATAAMAAPVPSLEPNPPAQANDGPTAPPPASTSDAPAAATAPVAPPPVEVVTTGRPDSQRTPEPERRPEVRIPEPRPVATTAERTVPPPPTPLPQPAPRTADATPALPAAAAPAVPEKPVATELKAIEPVGANLPAPAANPPVIARAAELPPPPAAEPPPPPAAELPPPPAAEPPPPPAAEPPPPPAEEPRVRAVLSRYESAYSGLNAAAAQAVWPGVDGRSLARAFDGLESQRVSLGRCAVEVEGATARADCRGSVTWKPKIGGGQQTASRQWSFVLANANGAWQITRAQAK